MQKRKRAEVEENITPNLIPMIDIMFLLLLFFMLGADMSQRQLEELVLPQATQVKEDDNKVEAGAKSNLTINIHHAPDGNAPCAVYTNGGICREAGHWKWAIRGHDYTKDTLKDQLQIEAQLDMETTKDPQANKILSARRVLIRADGAASYGDIQKVIEYCGLVGIYKVEVAAAKPAPDKKG
jgi:biopolymer transport protein ExbD